MSGRCTPGRGRSTRSSLILGSYPGAWTGRTDLSSAIGHPDGGEASADARPLIALADCAVLTDWECSQRADRVGATIRSLEANGDDRLDHYRHPRNHRLAGRPDADRTCHPHAAATASTRRQPDATPGARRAPVSPPQGRRTPRLTSRPARAPSMVRCRPSTGRSGPDADGCWASAPTSQKARCIPEPQPGAILTAPRPPQPRRSGSHREPSARGSRRCPSGRS